MLTATLAPRCRCGAPLTGTVCRRCDPRAAAALQVPKDKSEPPSRGRTPPEEVVLPPRKAAEYVVLLCPCGKPLDHPGPHRNEVQVCTHCHAQPATPGFKRCETCRAADRKYTSKSRAAKRGNNGCTICGKAPEPGYLRCAECRAKRWEATKRNRAERRAERQAAKRAAESRPALCHCGGVFGHKGPHRGPARQAVEKAGLRLCRRCKQAPARPGKARCETCVDIDWVRVRARRERNPELCAYCPDRAEPGRTMCTRCLARRAENNRKCTARRMEAARLSGTSPVKSSG